jgi:hypothetical protein
METDIDVSARRGFAPDSAVQRGERVREKARLKRRMRQVKARLEDAGLAPRDHVLAQLQLLREVIIDDEVAPPVGNVNSFAEYQRVREEHDALLGTLVHPVEVALLLGYLLAKSETMLVD